MSLVGPGLLAKCNGDVKAVTIGNQECLVTIDEPRKASRQKGALLNGQFSNCGRQQNING